MTNFCDTTNVMLCILLESINLMLLTLTRSAYNAIGGLGNYLGIVVTWQAIDRLSNMTGYK